MSNSGLTKYQDECLEILAEECGEIVVEKSKIFRFGAMVESHHHPGNTHIACLEQELGDILAMIDMVKDSGIGITAIGLEQAKQRKLNKVTRWMNNKE